MAKKPNMTRYMVDTYRDLQANAFLALVTVGALASALGAVSAFRLFTDKECKQ